MNSSRLIIFLFLMSVVGLSAQDPVSAGSGGLNVRTPGFDSGVIQEIWLTDRNASLRDFDDLVGWRRAPDTTEKLPAMAFSRDTAGTAITKLTTWIEAPASGDVFFWISTRGAAKLVVSQPDSIHPLAVGGLLFIRENLGWPAKGQWDLYPAQRLGPLAMEKGKRYLVEIWHGGQPGLKRCELAWAYTDGSPLVNWLPEASFQQGRLSPEGRFNPLREHPSPPHEKAAPDRADANGAPLFPEGLTQWFETPGDGLAYQLTGPKPVQRLTFVQSLRPDRESRQPGTRLRASLRDAKGTVLAETIFQPEAARLLGRFEWELPEPLIVSQVVLTLDTKEEKEFSAPPPIPYTIEAWGPRDGFSRSKARADLPANVLSASKSGPGDRDGNGLDDRWEGKRRLTFSTPARVTAAADEDGDGLLNQMESLAGRDPFHPDQLAYRLTADHWFDLPRPDVAGLTGSDAFHRAPDLRVVRWMERASPLPPNSGLRLRGYFTARETGPHQFWIAARNAGELWISEDATKFRKYKIASLSPAEGSGHGISRNAQDQWDQFASQVSRPIQLKAGQTYFIEALAQQGSANGTGQLNLAFAPPGGSRRTHDSRLISTFVPDGNDQDDDYLPDDWERLFGLNSKDNGLTDRARQGERGDFDGDGLSNLLEYQIGTDPTNPDTDGDGKTDGGEYHQLDTDPRSADVRASKDVLTLDPAGYSSSSLSWTRVDGALHAGSYRGTIDWSFEVPESGFYGYRLELALKGQSKIRETMPLALSVDDIPAARSAVSFAPGQPASWTVAGPWLAAGRHTLRLRIDNPLVGRSVIIHSLSVFQPEGTDFDRDGIVDWYAKALGTDGYSVRAASPVSRISPVCLEGTAPGEPETVTLNDKPVHPLGDHQWYADVPLEAGPNVIEAALPGQLPHRISITWQTTNVLEDATLQLRVGDSLLLAATTADGQPTTATCVSSEGFKLGVKNGTAWRFDNPGTVTLSSRAPGRKGTLTIHVASAVLPKEVVVIENTTRTIPFPAGSISTGVTLESIPGLAITPRGGNLLLLPSLSGRLAFMARLGPGGPIMAATPVCSIRVVDAAMQNATDASVDQVPAGYLRIRAPLLVWPLPDRVMVRISIYRGGMMFTDGTNRKTLAKSDFDDNGLTYLEFLYPNDLSGGFCHYLDIIDGDGSVIGRR